MAAEAMANLTLRSNSLNSVRTPTSSSSSTASTGKDRLVIGVDFGTTYSGVAAVYSGTPDDIEVIKTWPGGNGITSDKVPTELSYTPLPSRTPSGAGLPQPPVPHEGGGSDPVTYKWGFQPSANNPRLRCLKLFLDRSQTLPPYISPLETAGMLRGVGKTIIHAVTDYLSALYAHTIDTLTRRYGESFMAGTPLEWVLTVPAVWSDAAKNATRRAAEGAGMGGPDGKGIRLISEPEAAAVYTLKAIQPNNLSVGDNFVVCDAGGGTVDLISYEITSVSPSLLLSESSIGTGGLCGSAFLNYAFEDHCRRRLGAEIYDRLKPKTRNMALKYWDEYVKRNFKDEEPEEEEEISVPLPGVADDEEKRIEGGFLVMRREEVKTIFEPVVGQVMKLVDEQVEGIRRKGGKVAGIVLVGGFGQSNYLYSRLKTRFNPPALNPPPYSEAPISGSGGIEVMQPLYAWTAVVRGAVIRGLEGSMVVARQARFHYGTSYATVWEESKHPIQDRYWSPLWERWMVSDRMQWHIARGEPVSDKTPISFHYTRNFRPGQSLKIEDDLISCEHEVAPASMADANKHLVKTVCTLSTDLSSVPKSKFTRLTTSKGIAFDNLDFTLDLIVDSASLVFELKVEGVAYGSVTAKFH
ncbi:hypothetical protein HOY80DRAFT_1031541 [Tuber brumale]|nr:hypothetical protein HOY80DRAFT_1031541 [Tuber brumale]